MWLLMISRELSSSRVRAERMASAYFTQQYSQGGAPGRGQAYVSPNLAPGTAGRVGTARYAEMDEIGQRGGNGRNPTLCVSCADGLPCEQPVRALLRVRM